MLSFDFSFKTTQCLFVYSSVFWLCDAYVHFCFYALQFIGNVCGFCLSRSLENVAPLLLLRALNLAVVHKASRGQSSTFDITQNKCPERDKESWALDYCASEICHHGLAKKSSSVSTTCWANVKSSIKKDDSRFQNKQWSLYRTTFSMQGWAERTKKRTEKKGGNPMLITFKHFHSLWKPDKCSCVHFNLSANQEAISQLGVLLNANASQKGGRPPVCICPRKLLDLLIAHQEALKRCHKKKKKKSCKRHYQQNVGEKPKQGPAKWLYAQHNTGARFSIRLHRCTQRVTKGLFHFWSSNIVPFVGCEGGKCAGNAPVYHLTAHDLCVITFRGVHDTRSD